MTQLPGDSPAVTSWYSAVNVALPAILLGLIVRLLILGFLISRGYSPGTVAAMHDGGEYLQFSRSFVDGTLAALPSDVRRHDPGWPLLLAPLSFISSGARAYVVIWLSFSLTLIGFARSVLRFGGLDVKTARNLLLSIALLYPAYIYYQAFALSEAPFLLCLVASACLFLSKQRAAAYLLAGLAALIRTPGILLAACYVLMDLHQRNWKWLPMALLAMVPQTCWHCVSLVIWKTTSTSILSPRIGFPFSSYVHLREAGNIRAVYVLGVTAFAVASCVMLGVQAARSRWSNQLLNLSALFAGWFLMFHACVHSMVYLGKPVYTFHYMDRYLVGSMPFMMLAWRRYLRMELIIAGGLLACAISLYWGNNYLQELASQVR